MPKKITQVPTRASIAAAALALASHAVLAQDINAVRIDSGGAVAGQPVAILIDYRVQDDAAVYCGAELAFGDGSTRDLRIEGSKPPYRVEHTYAKPGEYKLSIDGKIVVRGLRTAFPCEGPARSVAVVVRPVAVASAPPAARAAAPAALPAASSTARPRTDPLSAYGICMTAVYGELIGVVASQTEAAARARIGCDDIRANLEADIRKRAGAATPQIMRGIDVEIVRNLWAASK